MSGASQDETGVPPEADIVEMVERALLAVRRDQSRRRPPWPDGAPHGHGPHGHWPHGGHWGGGPYGPGPGGSFGPGAPAGRSRDGQDPGGQDPDGPGIPDARDPGGHDSRNPDGPRIANGRTPSSHDSGTQDRFGPGGAPFGDSARQSPGRRSRDGSLGRIARVRMLEALETADAGGGSLSVSGVAAAIGVDQPRASRLVQEGVERGLVRRVPDPSDARRALIQLTASGRVQLTELRSHRRSAVETALAGFTPDEARTFAELFDRFVRAWPRPD